MKYNSILIASLCLFTSASAYSDSENKRHSGWYGGVSAGVANSGGSVLESSFTWKNDMSTLMGFDKGDTKDSKVAIKAGYVTASENRIEVYYKEDSISIDSDIVSVDDIFKTSTLGVNYQWGISSLSTEKMLPYVRVGAGAGTAEDSDLNVIELDIGAGIHYKMTDNIELSAGLYRRAIMVGEDKDNNDGSIGTVFNGAELGVNYHFLNLNKKGSARVN